MSYYSDVKILTTKAGWERIDQAVRKAEGITKQNESEREWLTDSTHTTELCDGAYVLGEWDMMPWYKGLRADTWAIEDVIAEFQEDGTPYHFVRVGEEFEDVRDEMSYDNPEDMPSLYISRKIEVEY